MIDFILCSDLHLRDTVPIARMDDYWLAQKNKIKFISDLQKEHNCPVLCAGDLFHIAKSSPFLESWVIANLPSYFFTIAGQHDLPNHNFENLNKSSLGVLISASVLDIINIPYGEVGEYFHLYGNKKIAMTHQMILKPKDEQDKIIGGQNPINLLKKYPEYNLILTGDNHKPFVVEYENRLLVNPGSMMRMIASQIDHEPRIYLYDAKKNEVEAVYFSIKKNVISREHIKIQKEKNKKIKVLVDRMKQNYEIGALFDNNMKSFLAHNKIRPSVEKIIWESMEE